MVPVAGTVLANGCLERLGPFRHVDQSPFFSIKNTCGPRERAFMVRSAVVCWLGITLFLGLMFLLSNPYRFLLWIPYAILLPLAVVYGNRTQQRIRLEELEHA